MLGMDRRTGLPLSGLDHLRQSIEDILTTPIGSRRMRPGYGSRLRRYVDLPVNDGWKSAVGAALSFGACAGDSRSRRTNHNAVDRGLPGRQLSH